jgi:alanine dehydrogenase
MTVADSARRGAGRAGRRAGAGRRGRVFVDDVLLALTAGALGAAALSAAGAIGTLSQVLQRTIPGRQTDADIIIYTPVGLPWQDLALGWAACCNARASGLGREFDFLA